MKRKKYIAFLLAAAVIVTFGFSLTAFAVPSDDPDEPQTDDFNQDEPPSDAPPESPDNSETSYADEPFEESYSTDYSQDYTEPDSDQYYESEYSYDYNEYAQDPYYDDYSDYDYDNDYDYDDEYNEYDNDAESYDQEENYEESYEDNNEYNSVTVTDPFSLIAGLEVILPADRPDFKPKEESSKQEESSAATATIKKDTDLLSAPPTIPIDETVSSVTYNRNDNDVSVFMGIIFWSIIGIVITAILIIIINFKGDNSEFTFRRKRYHKNNFKPSKTSVNKYKIIR